jgi:hypothetical protein
MGVIADPPLTVPAQRICDVAAERGVEVRLLGGIAIWIRASPESRALLGREYADIDLVTGRKQSKALRDLLESLEYVADKMFNAVQGDRRLYFEAADGSHHLDVFVEKFVMCHELDLGRRLTVEPLVLPAAELLLTKLQIAELNRKDASDTVLLLLDHEPSGEDGSGRLNVAQVASVCGEDWGLYTTVTDNLVKTEQLLGEILPDDDGARARVAQRITQMLTALEEAPKSRGWRRRAKVGRRVRWYEVPDEVRQ